MEFFRKSVNGFRYYLILLVIAGASTVTQGKWLTIHNDFFQFDTDGNPIRTRSGCLCKFGETYYWYGCDQAMTNQTCYSSTDLLHWTNHGSMLTATRGSNRMDVLYNDSTKKYVMVIKWETPGPEWCNRAVATSDSPTGPFTKLFDSTVYGVNTGDMSVFKDDDGKAYYCFELWDNGKTTQMLSLLTWDYINLEKKIQTWSNSDREAELIMKRRGMYYYMTSGMMGIDPTETQYFTAPKIDGPWTTKLVPIIAPGDVNKKSWDTQCDFVYRFKGTEDTVQMYCGDRWKRLSSARNGDYVWLPITFTSKDSVVINYYQDWEVDPDRGVWRAIDDKRNLALNKTVTASSTNGSNVPNNVTSPSTWQNYMDTKWVSETSDPQWIMVDLGSPMPVNRVILKWDSSYAKSFKIQISNDAAGPWNDVFSTTKAGARSVTDETFSTVTTRYVRMYGTQRGNTSGGYSLFDFMVLNDTISSSSVSQRTSQQLSKSMLNFRNNKIYYTVTSGNPVKIDIIDYRGKMAAVLVDGFKQAGYYETVLPCSLAPGMYIIRMTAGTKRLTTLKVRL